MKQFTVWANLQLFDLIEEFNIFNTYVWIWELDHKGGWALKNWCFQIVVLEKTLENPLNCKKIEPLKPKGDQPWALIGRTDAEAETPILLPPDMKNWLLGKDPVLGKIEGGRKRGRQRMRWLVSIINSLDMNLSKLGYIGGRRCLVCCSSWCSKELDTA